MICSRDYCTEPARVLGLCRRHYMREWRLQKRGGVPAPTPPVYRRDTDSVLADIVFPNQMIGKVGYDPESECWPWLASVDSSGYGRVRVGDKLRQAHRLSYEHFVGAIPAGLTLDHLCSYHRCVNPHHLDPVTSEVNTTRQVRRRIELNGRGRWDIATVPAPLLRLGPTP